MLTNASSKPRRLVVGEKKPSLLLVGVAVGLAILIVSLRGTLDGRAPGGPGASESLSIPPDVLALGTAVHATSDAGKISREDAIAASERAFGGFPGRQAEAYLVELTDPMVLGGLDARPLWIVKYTGVDLAIPVPNVPNIDPRSFDRKGNMYSYVDAVTGEWLMARTD